MSQRSGRFRFAGLFLLACLLGLVSGGDEAIGQWLVTTDLTVAFPSGEFSDVADPGTGLALKGQYRLRNWPSCSFKADATFITYQYGLYNEYGYPIESRTQSVRFTVGPQFSVRYRRCEAYLCPMFGLYNFSTRENIASTTISRTRNSSTELGWNVSGGMMITIVHMPKRSFDLALDAGLSWHSVADGVRIEVEDETVEQDVRELCVQAGVVFLFR